uniref:uncharacterized protein LOC120338417 isoform X2 n=1 Tax=Styela clava TaxID=7725 RepID=UPI00193A6D57|nr:uncharacterized protein LOC120338417 isoform X2 [Styela clava]
MFGMWLKLHQQIKFTALLSCYMGMKTKVIFLFGILTTANVVNCFTIANDGITTCKNMARDHQGQSFEIHCPAGCDAFTNRLWGTTVYTDDSYICAAAIHEGKLTVDGGYVKVWKSGSRSAYSSTTKNGITSKSYGYWRGSFHFTDSPKVELEETVLCTKQANSNNQNHFVATCPSGCDSHTSRLWGTIVYTDDSYICAAAIHAGVIEATNGGDVTVWKSNGRSSYSGTSRNGITSKSYGSWGGSFQFTDSRNNQQATSCTIQANNYDENHFTVVCPSGCDSHVSRLWGSVIYTDDSYICAAAIHDGVIEEGNAGGKVNVWKSDGRSNYYGTSRNGITSKSYGSWSSSFQFTDSEIVQQTISCTTQANNYDEDHFTVVCPSGCDSHVSRLWGSAIYTDDSYICAAAIHDGVIEANAGGKVNVWKSDGRSNYLGTLGNGITSKSYGSWSGSFQFPETISCTTQANNYDEKHFNVVCPSGCDSHVSRLWGSVIYTDDSYICAAAIHDGVIEANEGGKVNVWKSDGRSNYIGTSKNAITSKSYGSWTGSFQFTDSENVQQTISCTTQANNYDENHFTVVCPSGCDSHVSRLWGSATYTDDSYICAAAIHDGVIEANSGGQVNVWKSDGRSNYSGTSTNGITSKSYGSWSGSFQFTEPKVVQDTVQCTTQANTYNKNHFTVICPGGCESNTFRLWGNEIYTDDSYICAAAIHNGVIEADEGGKVQVWKMDGRSSYLGTTRNGVTSKSYGAWSGSFKFNDSKSTENETRKTISCLVQANTYDENHFTVVCPIGCNSNTDRLWGNVIYTDDSYICASAIHDGIIGADTGGEIVVWKSSGRNSYSGATRFGIRSKSYGKWSGSFQFSKPQNNEENVGNITCETKARSFSIPTFTVVCPSDCATKSYSLWGTGTYTDDSSICAAAIHEGVLTAGEAGHSQVWKIDGMSRYVGSTQHGITSQNYGEWSGSFMFEDPALVQMKDNKQDTIVEDEP